jgi:hypothetical protein
MEVLLGKSSVNGPFSIAMLNYQRVYDFSLNRRKHGVTIDPIDSGRIS